MGGHPYWYFTPYQSDINAALQSLRQQEFEAGRYNPVNPFPFNPDLNQQIKAMYPDPGNYSSIEAALEASMESGTRSILDIESVSDEPGTCMASPVLTQYLVRFFGSDKPSRRVIESVIFEGQPIESDENTGYEDEVYDLFELIDRGESRYIVVYDGNQPSEIFFVGYSFD
jgi:hypothetical protein